MKILQSNDLGGNVFEQKGNSIFVFVIGAANEHGQWRSFSSSRHLGRNFLGVIGFFGTINDGMDLFGQMSGKNRASVLIVLLISKHGRSSGCTLRKYM